MNPDVSQFIVGVGIYFLALRLLNSVAGRGSAFLFKPVLEKLTASNTRCFWIGLGLSILFGLEIVAVLGALGLANASLISFECAFFWILGAVLGSAFGGYIPGFLPQTWLLLLMAVLGGLLLFFRRVQIAGILEILLALCLAGVGLEQVGQAFSEFGLSLSTEPTAQGSFQWMANGWLQALMQTSSTAVVQLFELGAASRIPLQTGAFILLGVHLATPVLACLACLEFRSEGRRLAFALLLIKLFAVLLAWFFEPAFLQLATEISAYLGRLGLVAGLYSAHASFAGMTVLLGALAYSPLTRFLNWWWPAHEEETESRPPRVLRILASSPKRAIREAQHQYESLRGLSKELFDDCLQLMSESGEETLLTQRRRRILRSWQSLYRGSRYLLLNASIAPSEKAYELKIRKLLSNLNDLDQLFCLCMKFHEHLDHQLAFGRERYPLEFRELFIRLKPHLSDLFILVMADRAKESEVSLVVQKGLDALDKLIFEKLQARELAPEQAGWMQQSTGDLRKVVQCLQWQFMHTKSARGFASPDKSSSQS